MLQLTFNFPRTKCFPHLAYLSAAICVLHLFRSSHNPLTVVKGNSPFVKTNKTLKREKLIADNKTRRQIDVESSASFVGEIYMNILSTEQWAPNEIVFSQKSTRIFHLAENSSFEALAGNYDSQPWDMKNIILNKRWWCLLVQSGCNKKMGNGSRLWSTAAKKKHIPSSSKSGSFQFQAAIWIQCWANIKIGFIIYVESIKMRKPSFFCFLIKSLFHAILSLLIQQSLTEKAFNTFLAFIFSHSGRNFTHSMNLFANMMWFCLFFFLCWAYVGDLGRGRGQSIMEHMENNGIMALSHWVLSKQTRI